MDASEGSVWQRRKSGEMDQNKDKKSYGKKISNNKEEKNKLIRYEELPEYMKDNEYILDHYRANWPLKKAFFSLFWLHNETLNIWTHLIGFALFMGLTIAHVMCMNQVDSFIGISHEPYTSSKLINIDPSTPLKPGLNLAHETPIQWPFFIFLSGSMFCLLSSSMCHLFCCHSHNLNIFLYRLDYTGIAIMIITSFFPPIYYIFKCEPIWQITYLSIISIMGTFTIGTLLTPARAKGKFRAFRAMLFLAMGLFGVIPATHSIILNWSDPTRNMTMAYEGVMGLFYIIGTIFYVTRIPERWKPGWFDLAGNSHQIFHVFVVFAALAHYSAALLFLNYHGNVDCNTI